MCCGAASAPLGQPRQGQGLPVTSCPTRKAERLGDDKKCVCRGFPECISDLGTSTCPGARACLQGSWRSSPEVTARSD